MKMCRRSGSIYRCSVSAKHECYEVLNPVWGGTWFALVVHWGTHHRPARTKLPQVPPLPAPPPPTRHTSRQPQFASVNASLHPLARCNGERAYPAGFQRAPPSAPPHPIGRCITSLRISLNRH